MTRAQLISTAARMWSAVAFVAVAGAVTVVLAQAPAGGGHHESPAIPAGGPATLAPDQQQMMKMMAADDEKLAGLVTTMNAAKGDQKVAAIAAVVTELAAQRTRMMQMMRMQTSMMDQMMSHMAAMHGAGGMMNKQAPAPTPGADEQDHAAQVADDMRHLQAGQALLHLRQRGVIVAVEGRPLLIVREIDRQATTLPARVAPHNVSGRVL